MDKFVLIVGTSLTADSNSQRMAQLVAASLRGRNIDHAYFDLREKALPFCGDPVARHDENQCELLGLIRRANAVVFCAPVHNYGVSGATTNLLSLIPNDALEGKICGLALAAGGNSAYMGGMDFISRLMLDYRAWVAPKFVYAMGKAFNHEEDWVSEDVLSRLRGLVDDVTTGPASL